MHALLPITGTCNSCSRQEKKEEKKEIPIKRVAEQAAKQTIVATQNAWFWPLIKEIKEEKKDKKEPQIILQLPDELYVGIMTALIYVHLQNIMKPGLGLYTMPKTY